MFARRRSTRHSSSSRPHVAVRRTALLLLGGLYIASPVPAFALTQDTANVVPSARNSYDAHIAEAARRFRLAPVWIRTILMAESAGDPGATSRKGAMGLMQIVPATWSDLHARYRLGGDPYEPHDNIMAGAAYIRELLDRYGSPGWIAAYNAGPGRYEASLQGRPLPRETRAYVAVVASAISSASTVKPVRPVVSTPPGWKHAPLFIAQPNGKPAAYPVSAGHSHSEASKTATGADRYAVATRPDSLFSVQADGRNKP